MTPYYEEDGIVIFHSDCRDVLPQLAPVAHMITDPPYSEATHGRAWRAHELMDKRGAFQVTTPWSGLGFDALASDLRRFIAREAARLVTRWTLAFSDIESAHLWAADLDAEGLEYIRTCIWDKVDSTPQFTGDRPANGAEAIVCAHPAGRKRWNGGGGRNVFAFRANGEYGAKPHPAAKPAALMRHLVGLFASPGETILDPFAGSGSTLVAAKALGCRAIGIEIEERWCEAAAERLRQQAFDFVPLPEPAEQLQLA